MQKQHSRTPVPDKTPAYSFGQAVSNAKKNNNKGLLSDSSSEDDSQMDSSDDEGKAPIQVEMSQYHPDYVASLAAVAKEQHSMIDRLSSKYGLSPVTKGKFGLTPTVSKSNNSFQIVPLKHEQKTDKN